MTPIEQLKVLRAELDQLKKQEPVGMRTISTPCGNPIAWWKEVPPGAKLYLAPGAQPAEIEALQADAARYAAKRKEIFLKSMRMQGSGERQTEEEFNANYDANCDRAIKGFVADHRGVLVFNSAMVKQPQPTICGNCDMALPKGCGGQFLDDGEHCRFGKADAERSEPCPECFSCDCNGECSGDGAMGD